MLAMLEGTWGGQQSNKPPLFSMPITIMPAIIEDNLSHVGENCITSCEDDNANAGLAPGFGACEASPLWALCYLVGRCTVVNLSHVS